jgi:hypothetical protein
VVNCDCLLVVGVSANGLDRSCEATIYPVLDKPPPPGLVTTEERYDHFQLCFIICVGSST